MTEIVQAALSQRRNYLFIAFADGIHVFKPQLPAQVIPSKPELVLNLPKSREGLRGYIDVNKPHAVNHLIVADLGTEEVLVAACDDGDVIAYSVRSIHIAILENHESKGAGPPQTAQLRTLLLSNVGASAWGLAVHKVARLIAVSSNTHHISVFAFSLHQMRCMKEPCDEDVFPIGVLGDVFWERKIEGELSPYDRSQNLEIILQGHMTNIPNISFCNTESDRLGRFLASTDIDGKIFIWNIWRRRKVATFTAGLDSSGYSQLVQQKRNKHIAEANRKWLGGCLSGPAHISYGTLIAGNFWQRCNGKPAGGCPRSGIQ